MKAIILAAGKGTRLQPLTFTTPKPMISIAGKPIIEHTLEQIYRDVDEIIIVVKYLKEKISDYFGDNFKGTKITYFEQGEDKGTGGAIRGIKFGDDFLLINGDSIFEKKDIEKLIKLDGYGCLTREMEDPSKYGVFLKNKDGFVEKIIEKPKEFYGNTTNVGVYKFSSDLFEINNNIELSERGEFEITDSINGFCKKNNFSCIDMQGEFIDVGYIEDITSANNKVKKLNYQKPSFGNYNIIEKFGDFSISLGIPKDQIENIIKYSQDKTDIAMIKGTGDLKRFSDIKKFEKWYNDKNRFLFCLLEKNNKIAGIWWGRPTNFPKVNSVIDEKIYNLIINEKENIHTSGIRIYPEFRGKGLSKLIFNSEIYYRNIFPKALICIDIEKENIASQKAYEKMGYKYFATGKNDNESTGTSDDRMIYISFPNKK